jgi:hypothetical protein
MKRSGLVLFSIVAILAASSVSLAQESLISAYSALLHQALPAIQLQKDAAAAAAPAVKTPERKTRTFNLDFNGWTWRLLPNPNPPGSGLEISVAQGDHVKLDITYSAFRRDDPTNFDIDDLPAMIDGKPSKGVHLWLQPHNEIIVEFDANTPGIKLIRNPSGRIITTK